MDVDNAYSVYFKGKLRDGWDITKASQFLSEKRGLSTEKINTLFKQKIKIKGNLTEEQALSLAKKFYICGLILSIKKTKIHSKQSKKSPLQLSKDLDFKTIFSGSCPQVKTTFSYKAGLLLTILLTITLPLIYFSIISAVSYGIYLYINALLSNSFDLPSSIYLKLLVWVVPPFISFILLTFLLKPFFASYRIRHGLLLNRAENPEFYELVNKLCDYVGAKRPKRIYINSDVNASASLYNGIKGVFTGNLVLTIGMPLITGMNAQQLVGVLAHEFGHFTQRGGMIAYYLVNSVNHWFYSRAYEEDSWDETLDNWMEDAENGIWVLTLFLTSVCIGLTRRIMATLLSISMRCSFYLSRQMEFDADSYEAAVSGSKTFKKTAKRLQILGLAQAQMEQVNIQSYDENFKVFDNLPYAISTAATHMSIEYIKQIEQQMDQIKTNIWDSHPADSERISYAENLEYEGIFPYQSPASDFINNAEELSKKLTLNYYQEFLVNPRECLTPNNEIINYN